MDIPENANNGDDDHQLNEGKTLLVELPSDFHNHEFSPFYLVYYQNYYQTFQKLSMVMPPSTAFTSSLEFLRSIFSFAWALMQFACQQRATAAE